MSNWNCFYRTVPLLSVWAFYLNFVLYDDLSSNVCFCQEEILDETDEYVNIHNR